MTPFQYLDSLQTKNTNCNTVSCGNKLVTIFARHLDSFILTINFSLILQIRDFGSGQILQPRQLYLSPVPIAIGIAKIAPWWLVRRDYFLAKVPGPVSADGATNVYSLNRRAVSKNTKARQVIRLPALQVIKYTVIKNIFTVYKFVPRHATCTFKLSVSGDKSCCLDNLHSQPHKSANAHIKNWQPATFC